MLEDISLEQLPAAIEALLFVSDEPVSAVVLAKMVDENVEEIELALQELQRQLDEGSRGIQLREVAGGWRLYTHPAFHELVEKYVLSWDTRRLSSAALETLAIIAYSQPVTRAQVSAIRGVTSDGPIGTLVDRGYVREAGTADTPGNPTLYATTATFLEKYGLGSIADLPDLEEFAPDEKTAQLIRERLGAPVQTELLPAENDMPTPEQMAAEAQAALFGVVEKVDFDNLTFNMDEE
ncbi:MAG: SMC-Scp complex subunit ScpB [Eggerthellaceae bacterium]|nr:SMC-Scp complex subunit ScpB [Eggerthellaceae bacterium]